MSIAVRPLDLPGVLEIVPVRRADARGHFTETYKKSEWAAAGIDVDFVQDNVSFSADRFTLRGLHYQTEPKAQAKIVRVIRGRVWDVAVDIRPDSESFGRWVGLELSAERGNQIYIPAGFAHGFLTLEPDVEAAYKASAEYSPAHDTGLAWDDPDLAVAWPLGGAAPVLSDKDRRQPRLAEIGARLAAAR